MAEQVSRHLKCVGDILIQFLIMENVSQELRVKSSAIKLMLLKIV